MIVSISITRTELVGDAYFLLFTVLHASLCTVFNYLRYFESTFSLIFMLAMPLLLESGQLPAKVISADRQKTGICSKEMKGYHLLWVECQPFASF